MNDELLGERVGRWIALVDTNWMCCIAEGRVKVGCIFWRWTARYFGIESLGLLIAGWVFELRSTRVGRWITVCA